MTPFERALVGELEGSHGDRVHVGDVHGATALHHYAGLNFGLRPGLGGHVHICLRLGAWGRLRVCRIPPCGAAPPCRVGRERSTVPSRRSPRLSTEATSTGSAAVKPSGSTVTP